MGFVVAWILWSDLLGGESCVLYSLVDGAVDQLPCSVRAAVKDPDPVQLADYLGTQSGHSVCNEFSIQVRSPVFLCRCRKLWDVLPVYVSLYIGLWNQPYRLPCVLVRFPGWAGRRLYSAMRRATDEVCCQGKRNSRPVKLFVVLPQADPCPKFPERLGHCLCSVSNFLALHAQLLAWVKSWPHRFQVFH